jgi:ribonuclease Z
MSSVRLVFLGTGSGKPMPGRSVSAVGLQRDGDLFLFDCGEGAQVQLARSTLRPGSLAGIFLTHFHGDHVNGLPGLLGTLTLNQRDGGLPLVGPRGTKRWLRTLRELGILTPGFPLQIHENEAPGVVHEGDGYKIITGPLNHRVTCWGYAYVEEARPGRFDLDAARALGVPHGPLYGKLQRGESIVLDDGREITPSQVLGPARPGLKIAYCCDTSPHPDVVELARGADLLIHESTYPAGDEDLARERRHSTSADAARCAVEAGVKKLVLTHFSQKHTRTDEFLAGARAIFPDTIAAYDLMEIEVERSEQDPSQSNP